MRRAFILFVGSVAAISPIAARAQQPPMMEPAKAAGASQRPRRSRAAE